MQTCLPVLTRCCLPASACTVLQLKALEAAEAARRKEVEKQAERQRQKAELERQRLERVKVGVQPLCTR